MAKDIWISSDFHLNHSNILRFTDSKTGARIRPEFSSVEEMNEIIIERHNSCVKPGDKFYTLGDVFFGDKEWFQKTWPRLMGSKRLIVGNHDDVKYLSSGGFFAKVMMWRVFSEFNILMSHVPLHESGLMRGSKNDKPMLHVHGHIHQNKSPKGPYHNVCVEHTDYRPVHIEDLAKIAAKI